MIQNALKQNLLENCIAKIYIIDRVKRMSKPVNPVIVANSQVAIEGGKSDLKIFVRNINVGCQAQIRITLFLAFSSYQQPSAHLNQEYSLYLLLGQTGQTLIT